MLARRVWCLVQQKVKKTKGVAWPGNWTRIYCLEGSNANHCTSRALVGYTLVECAHIQGALVRSPPNAPVLPSRNCWTPITFGYDHINCNPPVLIRTPKLTQFEPAQYWGGGPPGNSAVLYPPFFFFFFLNALVAALCSVAIAWSDWLTDWLIERDKKRYSGAGNWTRVSRVTGGNTNHYTTPEGA